MSGIYFRDHVLIQGECMCGETAVTQPGEWEQHLYDVIFRTVEEPAPEPERATDCEPAWWLSSRRWGL